MSLDKKDLKRIADIVELTIDKIVAKKVPLIIRDVVHAETFGELYQIKQNIEEVKEVCATRVALSDLADAALGQLADISQELQYMNSRFSRNEIRIESLEKAVFGSIPATA